MKPTSLLGYVCLFSALSGLAFSAPQKVETKDGVRIVHNVLPGGSKTGPSLGMKLVRTIGDVDSEDENLAFSGPRDIAENGAVGPDETVAVSFAFQNRIENYSREGKLMWKADRDRGVTYYQYDIEEG